jgi:glycosidase
MAGGNISPKSIDDLSMVEVSTGKKTSSTSAWEDEVLYFLMVDRFSDGNENVPGQVESADGTPLFTAADADTAIATDEAAKRWRDAGNQWVGGNLRGIISKLDYLFELGVTALWISPVLKQSVNPPGDSANYHGYATQNFLAIDEHYGTAEDLRELVAAAHVRGLRVILDIVINHVGDVFAYEADHAWDGHQHPVKGWRDGHGGLVPFSPEAAAQLWPDGAVWPSELHDPEAFTRKGYIANWDNSPEYLEGDFFGLKDVTHGHGTTDEYTPSKALIALTKAYCWWLAYADLDGFRLDTVKHIDIGATRYFASIVHEYAQALGKDRFILVGEITGPRIQAIDTLQLTGLDAALGIADVQYQLEATAKGWANPAAYFDLFRNSELLGKDSHTWLRNTVVTSYDDHDQVRKGDHKARFCADNAGLKLALVAMAINALTLGIPCIYYGSEQGLDGHGDGPGCDEYIREAMFGGEFGDIRSRGRHVFDPGHPLYTGLRDILAIRRQVTALRRGRQYLRAISGDGVTFGFPVLLGGQRLRGIVAWSRILAGTEIVCAINVDPDNAHSAWVTIDGDFYEPGDGFSCIYASHKDENIAKSVHVSEKNGRSIRITLPPGGVALYAPTDVELT